VNLRVEDDLVAPVGVGNDDVAPVLPIRLGVLSRQALERDPRAVSRKRRKAVDAGVGGQLDAVGAVRVGRPDVAVGDERDHARRGQSERRRQAALRSNDGECHRDGQQQTKEEHDRHQARN
jgi:hypothetical protein